MQINSLNLSNQVGFKGTFKADFAASDDMRQVQNDILHLNKTIAPKFYALGGLDDVCVSPKSDHAVASYLISRGIDFSYQKNSD